MKIIFMLLLFFALELNAKGDLSIRAKKLILDWDLKKWLWYVSKIFNLETGKAYNLEITSMGFKEYEFETEDFLGIYGLERLKLKALK